MSRRGIGVGLVGAGLLALVGIVTPKQTEVPAASPFLERFDELSARKSLAVIRWSLASVLDSTRARAPRSGWAADSLVVVFSGFSASDSTQQTERLLRQRWRSVPRPDSSVRIIVSVYNATPYFKYSRWPGPYQGASIARSGTGLICTAIIGATLTSRQRVQVFESMLDETVGPCLLLATFGPPGRTMSEWLAGNRYAPAGSNAWLDRPREFFDGQRSTPWEPSWDREWNRLPPSGLGLILGPSLGWMLAPPYYLGSPGLRCLNGELTACVQGVLEPVAIRPGIPEDLTFTAGLSSPMGESMLSTHRLASWFVSDLIREHGRERFAGFWRSDRPFEAAFQEAFGISLGEWTLWWARRQYGGSWAFLESGQLPILGANLRPSWILVVLLWTTLAVLLAATTARRRQVT